jgi:tetratricopeptide (TPR) repeat protein
MAHSGFGADLTSDGSAETGNLQGKVWLSGQLSSDSSLREVLEMVGGMKDARFGLLRILSKSVRGYVGILDGQTITGAHVTSTREFGLSALKKLFAAQKGIFIVLEIKNLPAELRQDLNFKISTLLEHQVNGEAPPVISDALDSLAAANPEMFMMNEAATAAATSGTDLAKVESYMAWGEESDAPKLSTNLSKITSSMTRPNADQIAASRAAVQHDQQKEQVQADLDRALFAKFAIPDFEAQPESIIMPASSATVPSAAAPSPEPVPEEPPKLKLTRPRNAGTNADDQQSMSQKIRALREDQAASQKLATVDADMIDDGPIEMLSPGEKRKRELVSIGSGAVGLLLFLALGQQVFNVTQAQAKYQSGIKALAAGDAARAQVELTTALKLGGNSPHAFLYRSLAESKLGHKERAVSDLNQMIAQNGKDSLARMGRAMLYLKSKDYPAAITDADEILRNDPHYADAYRIKALADCGAGHMKECIDDASSYLAITETDKSATRGRAEIFATRGFAYLKVKKYEQAISDYNNAITSNSASSKLYASRAVAFTKLKQWDSALEDARMAIKLDPSNAALYKLRGLCYEQAGEAGKAAQDMDTAAKMKPSLNAFRLRGAARLAAGDSDGAMEDFEYLLSVNPNDKESKQKYDEAKAAIAAKSNIKQMKPEAGKKAPARK